MNKERILELAKKTFVLEYHQGKFRGVTFRGNQRHILNFARAICEEYDFYRKRCELLQKVQKYMRDPERQIVCNILANNDLLPDPSGARYGQDLRRLIDL